MTITIIVVIIVLLSLFKTAVWFQIPPTISLLIPMTYAGLQNFITEGREVQA